MEHEIATDLVGGRSELHSEYEEFKAEMDTHNESDDEDNMPPNRKKKARKVVGVHI